MAGFIEVKVDCSLRVLDLVEMIAVEFNISPSDELTSLRLVNSVAPLKSSDLLSEADDGNALEDRTEVLFSVVHSRGTVPYESSRGIDQKIWQLLPEKSQRMVVEAISTRDALRQAPALINVDKCLLLDRAADFDISVVSSISSMNKIVVGHFTIPENDAGSLLGSPKG